MFFGQKLRELRLNSHGGQGKGIRSFAREIGMRPSKYSDMEEGYIPPPSDEDEAGIELIGEIISALEINNNMPEQIEFFAALREPFIMQKMPECGFIFHATKITGDDEVGEEITDHGDYKTRPATSDECIEITDYINDRAKEHNQKADEYNSGRQKENS